MISIALRWINKCSIVLKNEGGNIFSNLQIIPIIDSPIFLFHFSLRVGEHMLVKKRLTSVGTLVKYFGSLLSKAVDNNLYMNT